MPTDPDTEFGDIPARFTKTDWASLAPDSSSDTIRQGRMSTFIERYWRPIYYCIRRSWKQSNEDAKDITQSFFTLFLEKGLLDRAAATRGKFRSYLLTVLKHFMINRQEAARAQRRGGNKVHVSLRDNLVPDRAFVKTCAREWARGLVHEALADLRDHYRGREVYVRVLVRYELVNGATYKEVAKELGIAPHDVMNHLAHARQRLHAAIEKRIRDYCSTEEEFEDELSELFHE